MEITSDNICDAFQRLALEIQRLREEAGDDADPASTTEYWEKMGVKRDDVVHAWTHFAALGLSAHIESFTLGYYAAMAAAYEASGEPPSLFEITDEDLSKLLEVGEDERKDPS